MKLQGTYARALNFSYSSQYDEGTYPSSILCHARFEHLNYDNLRLLKKNGVTGFPTIPRKLKQCDASILGKHNKQYFHDFHFRAHRKLELIHLDLCGSMPIPSAIDRFIHAKYFQEFDYEIPHLEGGIPILDQYVESSSEALSPPHEAPTTDDILSDVIDIIGRLNLDSTPNQPTEKPRPSQKGPPKWLTKTLESVRIDEDGKTGTRSSTKQNRDVDNLDSLVDMDVSYDFELNVSTYFEPNSFKESTYRYEWKEVMQKEYDALIKNGTWKLVDPPLGTKIIGCKWVLRNKYK
eukprot:PITA_27795